MGTEPPLLVSSRYEIVIRMSMTTLYELISVLVKRSEVCMIIYFNSCTVFLVEGHTFISLLLTVLQYYKEKYFTCSATCWHVTYFVTRLVSDRSLPKSESIPYSLLDRKCDCVCV